MAPLSRTSQRGGRSADQATQKEFSGSLVVHQGSTVLGTLPKDIRVLSYNLESRDYPISWQILFDYPSTLNDSFDNIQQPWARIVRMNVHGLTSPEVS